MFKLIGNFVFLINEINLNFELKISFFIRKDFTKLS